MFVILTAARRDGIAFVLAFVWRANRRVSGRSGSGSGRSARGSSMSQKERKEQTTEDGISIANTMRFRKYQKHNFPHGEMTDVTTLRVMLFDSKEKG